MAIWIITPLVLACVTWLGSPALSQPVPYLPGPALLIHGNYCGLGNNAPLHPIDPLDAACARHDACSLSNGLPLRICNLRLQKEAEVISRDPTQPVDLQALAGFISAGAALLPFDPYPSAGSVRVTGYASYRRPVPSSSRRVYRHD